jgi:predicted permease
LWVDAVSVPGDTRSPWAWPSANVRFVNPDYLRTMGIPVLAGRTFSENDRNRKVVMISERLARTLWPGQDPVGRTLEWGVDQPFEVIGVAADVRANADKRPVNILYSPYWARPPLEMTLVARAAGDPRSIAGAMRAAVHRADADVPLKDMRTMTEVFQQSVAERRFQVLLAGAFAATALLLASLGIYGVVSYSVTRRTNEMGIRMALGAQSYNIYGMVLRQAMTPVVLGLAAGLGAALAAGRVLASLLYEVSPRDPFTIAAVALLLAAVGLAACVLPALRATRLDPLTALRCE